MICTIVIPVIMEIHLCMMVYICLYNMLNCYHSHYDDYILPGLQGEMMLRSAEKADQRKPEEPKDEILEDAVEEP